MTSFRRAPTAGGAHGRQWTPALVGALLTAVVPASAQPTRGDPLRSAERSVVRVVTVSMDALGEPVGLETGSGFAVAPGLVVTNRHMVQAATAATQVETFVIPERDAGGRPRRASVRATWAEADLALLAVPGFASPPLTIAQVAPGKEATVRALGYPGVTDQLRNLPLSAILKPQETYVTAGSIALFSAVAPGGAPISTIFHTAPINPGNSGGPLIDVCGRVVGVNTWGAGDELGENGQATTPQGQFIATQSSVLAKFLADSQVNATYAPGPCVPAAAQVLDDRLKSDEAAIGVQKDDIGRLAAALKGEQARERRLGTALDGLGAVVAALIVALAAFAWRPWERWRARLHRPRAEQPPGRAASP